ncbi:hypothetical protein ACWZEH_24410 [Streptomyces sp. QTS137]
MTSSQNRSSPDGPEREPQATGGSSVRRAVSLGPAAADPGAMLVPAARPSAAPASGTGANERNESDKSEAPPAQSAAVGATSATGATAAEPATTAAPSSSTTATTAVTAATAGPAAALGAQPQAQARAQAAPEAEGSARGMAAAGGAAGAAGAAAAGGAGEPPSGKPKKPLLAAAGIAGAVLLAVPLLIWATDDGKTKKDSVEVAAGSDTLLDEEPLDVPKGAYAPAEPSPEPSAEKSTAKPTPVVKAPVPVLTSAPPREPVEKKETEKKQTEKKAETAKTAEAEKVEENPPPKLPANTAGAAVQRLAASNPGRHICYRAYVKDTGWQSPRCDGAVAGGTGKGIKALNIAVSGTKGMSANEFIQKDGWTTKWESAANGIGLVLGSSRQSAPNLSGFAIDVGGGHVCQNHRVGGHDWGGLACDTVDPWVFGGSTEPHLWLESVRFTV